MQTNFVVIGALTVKTQKQMREQTTKIVTDGKQSRNVQLIATMTC